MLWMAAECKTIKPIQARGSGTPRRLWTGLHLGGEIVPPDLQRQAPGSSATAPRRWLLERSAPAPH
eukprot:CAMPEP_0197897004 /NCGR_PEP_ID=MMETSP1439-20131203/41397_1 /TAXON_ID=66791 /ORGANISM="Gonyaulax spinifera, Strain CCMP409" /LENGTH=65 /DNA_ID=CAMNT_0043517595 /DNA_START=118 /DNA_END=315 /DNA_ORIENTATION=-